MDYKNPGEENNEANESQAAYGSLAGKKVRIFNSFKEQEEEMIEYWASITPLQRLANLYEMIKVSFGITDEEIHSRKHISGKVTIIK